MGLNIFISIKGCAVKLSLLC